MKIVQKRLEQIIPGVSPESHHTLGTAGMRDLGFRVPIVLDQNGVAIKEHAPRIEAALRLGFGKQPRPEGRSFMVKSQRLSPHWSGLQRPLIA